MSDQTAKTHTHPSIRAKPREASERKVVFKSVLDNPFRVRWPSVPINVQNMILSQLVSMLDGLSAYHLAKSRQTRKRKRTQKELSQGNGAGGKKSRVVPEGEAIDTHAPVEGSDAGAIPATPAENPIEEPPIVLKHLTVGINQVTKSLESQVKSCRTTIATASKGDTPPCDSDVPIAAVFVCRADVDPPLLIAHLPHLVAAYNSCLLSRPSSRRMNLVKLVPLPKGAEFSLAEALGIRRVAALAFDIATPNLETFNTLLESVPTLSAEWLVPPRATKSKILIPTHIKQIKTSAPKDLKAAKEQRVLGRKAAKERKQRNASAVGRKPT